MSGARKPKMCGARAKNSMATWHICGRLSGHKGMHVCRRCPMKPAEQGPGYFYPEKFAFRWRTARERGPSAAGKRRGGAK